MNSIPPDHVPGGHVDVKKQESKEENGPLSIEGIQVKVDELNGDKRKTNIGRPEGGHGVNPLTLDHTEKPSGTRIPIEPADRGDGEDCAATFKKLCATYCCASSTDRAHVMRARCGLFNVGAAGLFAVGGGLAMKYAMPTEPYAGAVGALSGVALYAAVACCQTILQGCRERPGGVCLPLNFRDGCPWDARLVIQRP